MEKFEKRSELNLSNEQKEEQKCIPRKRGRPSKAGYTSGTDSGTVQTSKMDLSSSQNKSSDSPLPVPDPEPSKNDPHPQAESPPLQEKTSKAESPGPVNVTVLAHNFGFHTYFSPLRQVEPKSPLPLDHPYAVTESPVGLKRRCDGVTEKLEKCRKKLRLEQQRVRRWSRELSKMKAETKELRKEAAAPPRCVEMVEQNFSGVPKEMIKRMLGEKSANNEYSEELKAFACKLHLLSPKAYDYVRDCFEQALPHPAAMRKWQMQRKVGSAANGDKALQDAAAGEDVEFKKDEKRGAAPLQARMTIQQCQYARLRVKPEEANTLAEWVEIHRGLVVSICFFKGATEKQIPKMVKALLSMKLFEVGPGEQASVTELPGSVLVIPQDTLGGQPKRCSMEYPNNLESPRGLRLYVGFVTQLESQLALSSKCREAGVAVRYGVYGAEQALLLDSDGLATHIMEF